MTARNPHGGRWALDEDAAARIGDEAKRIVRDDPGRVLQGNFNTCVAVDDPQHGPVLYREPKVEANDKAQFVWSEPVIRWAMRHIEEMPGILYASDRWGTGCGPLPATPQPTTRKTTIPGLTATSQRETAALGLSQLRRPNAPTPPLASRSDLPQVNPAHSAVPGAGLRALRSATTVALRQGAHALIPQLRHYAAVEQPMDVPRTSDSTQAQVPATFRPSTAARAQLGKEHTLQI